MVSMSLATHFSVSFIFTSFISMVNVKIQDDSLSLSFPLSFIKRIAILRANEDCIIMPLKCKYLAYQHSNSISWNFATSTEL